jgi:hypothetical protein
VISRIEVGHIKNEVDIHISPLSSLSLLAVPVTVMDSSITLQPELNAETNRDP